MTDINLPRLPDLPRLKDPLLAIISPRTRAWYGKWITSSSIAPFSIGLDIAVSVGWQIMKLVAVIFGGVCERGAEGVILIHDRAEGRAESGEVGRYYNEGAFNSGVRELSAVERVSRNRRRQGAGWIE